MNKVAILGIIGAMIVVATMVSVSLIYQNNLGVKINDDQPLGEKINMSLSEQKIEKQTPQGRDLSVELEETMGLASP